MHVKWRDNVKQLSNFRVACYTPRHHPQSIARGECVRARDTHTHTHYTLQTFFHERGKRHARSRAHASTHARTHARMRAHTHTHTHTHTYTHTQTHARTHTHTRTHARPHTRTRTNLLKKPQDEEREGVHVLAVITGWFVRSSICWFAGSLRLNGELSRLAIWSVVS